jgi:hypothetical protein
MIFQVSKDNVKPGDRLWLDAGWGYDEPIAITVGELRYWLSSGGPQSPNGGKIEYFDITESQYHIGSLHFGRMVCTTREEADTLVVERNLKREILDKLQELPLDKLSQIKRMLD